MSLATRCPSCHTAFRVVQDQLKVSDGWVRCGRCNHVFNALEGLFDLDRSSPAVPPPAAGRPPSMPDTGAASRPAASPVSDFAPRPAPDDGTPAGHRGSPREPAPAEAFAPTQPAPVDEPTDDRRRASAAPPRVVVPGPRTPPPPPDEDEDLPGFTAADVLDSRFFKSDLYEDLQPGIDLPEDPPFAQDGTAIDPRDVDDREEPSLFPEDEIGDAEREAAMEAAAARSAEVRGQRAGGDEARPSRSDRRRKREQAREAMPTFLRHAERSRRWQSPAMRTTLTVCALLLSLALALQVSISFAGTIAARWPVTQPWMQAMCRMAGCRVEPPRRIRELTIESSSFTKPDNSERYRLALVLRNRGSMTVMMPAIELTLIDLREDVVARRTLTPSDFGVADALAAGGEQTLALTIAADALQAQGVRIAGYRVLAFYP